MEWVVSSGCHLGWRRKRQDVVGRSGETPERGWEGEDRDGRTERGGMRLQVTEWCRECEEDEKTNDVQLRRDRRQVSSSFDYHA